jgi:hypothetical protein
VHTGRIPHRRIASAAAVLVLHAGLIALFLQITVVKVAPRAERETILTLERLTVPKTGAGKHGAGPRGVAIPQFWIAPPALVSPPAIGDVLFRCRPETLDKLSEEQRARCKLALGGPPGNRWTEYRRPTSDVQYAELWQKGIKDRETPVEVPCARVTGGGASSMTTQSGEKFNGPPTKVKMGINVDYVCVALRLWQALNR